MDRKIFKEVVAKVILYVTVVLRNYYLNHINLVDNILRTK